VPTTRPIAGCDREIYPGRKKNRKPKEFAMSVPLDPAIAKVLPTLPLRDPDSMTPQSAREALHAVAASRAHLPPPPVTNVQDIVVEGAAGGMAARVYRMAEANAPTIVFFHGGGWVAGDLDTHDWQARLLAIETGAVVVSIDYRRPPEVRFPGAFEDGFAALRDVARRIGEFGGDPSRLAVAGDSAGGNLAAAVAIAARDARLPLAGQFLVYPVVDVVGNFADTAENARFPSRTENADGYFLTRGAMEWFCGHYLGNSSDGADWRASPLRAESLAGVAPAVICTAWFDPLRDEGIAFASALQAAGVAVRHHQGLGLIHGFFGGIGEVSDAARLEAQRARADFKMLITRGI
jgi:acetyl esterase